MSKHRDEPKQCPVCGGSGEISTGHDGADGQSSGTTRCGACNGTGQQP
ncbi:DnaJ-class molecular chaperone [Lipingzhangella halophila]|uniref:DnaJ-class molecular chaperone n=1 Tax=Lipingzhangella halophila TaxID=1783352 RepID=A0A7W7W2S3_9ACTN|nr:DnaJ-class molecular chaperone [Lipingzhangella halophila]